MVYHLVRKESKRIKPFPLQTAVIRISEIIGKEFFCLIESSFLHLQLKWVVSKIYTKFAFVFHLMNLVLSNRLVRSFIF